MMRLTRRSSSETDTTSTRRELRRLLLFTLVVGLVISLALAALMAAGIAVDPLGKFRDGLLRMVGFGALLLGAWILVFIFALAFRRHWLRRYNFWLASAALVVAAIGALSFLSPTEGLLGWFSLNGEVSPGGQLGDLIIGSRNWVGGLRASVALAVAGALLISPTLLSSVFQGVGAALASLFNRRKESSPEASQTGEIPSEIQLDDTPTSPSPGLSVSNGPVGVVGGLGSSYTDSGSFGARGSFGNGPGAAPVSPYTDSAQPQSREPFDFRDVPIRSAPVPSLANYISGLSGSDSLESGIRGALATPSAPVSEPMARDPKPYEDGDPFKPLNLSKLPEPVFAFSAEPETVMAPEEEDKSDTENVPVSESAADLGEYEGPAEDIYDEPEDEFIDDADFDFDSDSNAASVVASPPAPGATYGNPVMVDSPGSESDSASGLIGGVGSDRGDDLLSDFDPLSTAVSLDDQATFGDSFIEPSSESESLLIDDSNRGDYLMPDLEPSSGGESASALMDDDDLDRGDYLMPDFDSSPAGALANGGDTLPDVDSSVMVVDVSDQATFEDSFTELPSDSNSESSSVLMRDDDSGRGDYLTEFSDPLSGPDGFDGSEGLDSADTMREQPATQLKTNKYWALDSDIPAAPAPLPQGLDRTEARSTRANVPVVAAWRKPSIRMLNTAPSSTISEEEQQATADAITRTLADYGIEVGVKDIRPGPTVTMYGLTPGWIRKNRSVKQVDDDGLPLKDEKGRLVTKQVEEKTRVRVDSILAREKDLSLALKTPSIRLETPAMGKSLIGIEVPNPNPSLVTLRSIMEGAEFQEMRDEDAHLPVALGQGSGGEPVVFDLAKMPHLLVAGATGSGKSVCLNAIVSCLITEKTPAEMRMILVDPKRVELTPYNGIPHLLAPVIVETDTVVGYLKGLIREMFDRYRRMEEVGVRNIEAYNSRMPDKMPFLCVVIDELADLMMTAAVDVEQSICRLAQLGRATGIHMIIATQRPSVDVLTGLIKANFPSRISFGVTSQVDSRTILDTGGADKLLGRGDMLYLPLDASKPSRVQSVFIGDSEIEKLVGFWQSTPRQPLDVIDLLGGGDPEMGDDAGDVDDPDRDEMIDKAIEIAISHRKLSTSLLQRRLRIGYPRAARLMDQLEDEGIVGPGDGSKSRDVIMNQN